MEIFQSSQSLLLSFSIIISVIFIYVKWIRLGSKNRKNIPPSPRKLPIIGNFHQLGSIPSRNLQILSQKYGPIMLLHFGSIPTVIASSAEAAEEIMKTHDLSLCSRPTLTIPNILLYGSKSISFSPYGEYWRRMKSIIVLKLLSNTRVKSYKKVREDEIVHMIRVLGESCGTTVDMGSMFVSLTNNIICRVALGRKFDGLKYTDLLKRFMDMFTAQPIKIAKEFDEFLEGIIEEHLSKKKKEGAKSIEEEDFVDILLEIQKDKTSNGFTLHRDSLKVVLLEAFLAGTETTYASLEWALSELIRNPRVMKKLQQEVTEIAQGRSKIYDEDLEKMPYLKAVLKESLRLHTPAPLLIPRKSMQDIKLMGYDIAADTQVIINAWAIGRDPALWEEPYEFKPERFLNNAITYQGFHSEWLPFGGGRRVCPGINFSVHVIELAIANIVYKFDMVLPNGVKNEDLDMSEEITITAHKKSSLRVLVSPRF
ncbi:putative cytochrome P450 [Helianthus anomalus]